MVDFIANAKDMYIKSYQLKILLGTIIYFLYTPAIFCYDTFLYDSLRHHTIEWAIGRLAYVNNGRF